MTLDITKIKAGFPGVSPVTAAHLYEAFMVCMNHHMHPQEVALSVDGQKESVVVKWENACDDTILRTYADMQYTTEHGAVCLSLMLTTAFTPYTIIERSRKGTGFVMTQLSPLIFQLSSLADQKQSLKQNSNDNTGITYTCNGIS